MADSTEGRLPPRPECEFQFDLPCNIDIDDTNCTRARGVDAAAEANQFDDEVMDDDTGSDGHTSDSLSEDQTNAQQNLNYDTLQQGFSDDEGGHEAHDRSWAAHQARKSSKRRNSITQPEDAQADMQNSAKKSRRSLFGGTSGDNESNERTNQHAKDVEADAEEMQSSAKEPGRSLFGGAIGADTSNELNELDGMDESVEMNESNECTDPQHEEQQGMQMPISAFRDSFSHLDLGHKHSEDECEVDSGFGSATFERDSVSSRASPAPSEDDFDIPPDSHHVYGLRQNIDRAPTFTYMDNDKTGDYDPAEERREQRAEIMKKLVKKRIRNAKKEQNKVVKEKIIKLRIGDTGKLRGITNNTQNGPRRTYRRITPDREGQTLIQDSPDVVIDLTGHPAARGCYGCRRNKDKRCSIVEGGSYPCEQCAEGDEECTLIVPATVNGRCKKCTEDKIDSCSFENNPNQVVCNHCADNDHICIASTPNGYRPARASIDEIMYSANRKYIQCTHCRMHGMRCNLKKATDKPPCKYCKKHGIGCTFYDSPLDSLLKQPKGKQSKGKETAAQETNAPPPKVMMPSADLFSAADLEGMNTSDEEDEINDDDQADCDGVVTIMASFAYPIVFSLETPTIYDYNDCNFCNCLAYGFVGYYEREVGGVYNGLEFEEWAGHCETHGPTKMCGNCTSNRAQIICCEGHDMRLIEEELVDQDFAAAVDELACAPPGSEKAFFQLQRWCSMCFSLAKWSCKREGFAFLLGNAPITSCGLRLCDRCMYFFENNFFSNLDGMVAEMESCPKTTEAEMQLGMMEGKVRADVELLKTNGLLGRKLQSL